MKFGNDLQNLTEALDSQDKNRWEILNAECNDFDNKGKQRVWVITVRRLEPFGEPFRKEFFNEVKQNERK